MAEELFQHVSQDSEDPKDLASFTLHIDHQKTKKKMPKNGVPQGSVLAPIYDIALLTTGISFSSLNDTLTDDLTNLNKYFINWRLKMNETKTVSSTFHLANRLANIQLEVKCAGNTIPFEKSPIYLGVTLDRTLTYKQHLQAHQKILKIVLIS
uniref:Reverse transcriptase domain-containing protein n=1 Tax=Gadus morhua TaxID=8049 RepID=A0A8C5B7A4_GADMO